MVTATRRGYTLNELSRQARKHALDALRDTVNDDPCWHEGVFEDFLEIAKRVGLEIGECRNKPAIYFSGFSCQGDGACFEGTWRADNLKIPELLDYAPNATELHQIVYPLWPIKRLFSNASATLKHTGRYYHEMSVTVGVSVCNDEGDELETDAALCAETTIIEAMRGLMRWLYKTLEKEYDDLQSDEAIIELADANEWRFNHNGTRYLGRG